jgi:hypothetical protein
VTDRHQERRVPEAVSASPSLSAETLLLLLLTMSHLGSSRLSESNIGIPLSIHEPERFGLAAPVLRASRCSCFSVRTTPCVAGRTGADERVLRQATFATSSGAPWQRSHRWAETGSVVAGAASPEPLVSGLDRRRSLLRSSQTPTREPAPTITGPHTASW